MGTCSSNLKSHKRIQKSKQTPFSKLSRLQNISSHKKTQFKIRSPRLSQQTHANLEDKAASKHVSSVVRCMGLIVGKTLDYRLKMTRQKIGIGCLISKNILLASDHYLYAYESNQLYFHPLSSKHQTGIRISKCIFPSQSIRNKKRSMYLHKKLGVALYELKQDVTAQTYLQLGINLQEEGDDGSSLQDYLQIQRLIDKSREFYSACQFPQLAMQRGWPLLYKLYDQYYCVGLYSSPFTSDFVLFNQKIVQRFQNVEEKMFGSNQIGYLQIKQSLVEVCVVDKERRGLQELLKQLSSAQKQCNKLQQAEVLFNVGLQYGYKGNLSLQKQYYHRSLQLYLASEHHHDQNVAALYHNIGICESQNGSNEKAEDYLLKALQMKMLLKKEEESIGDTYNQLGTIYKKMNRMGQSLQYYHKALSIFREYNIGEKIGMTQSNINLIHQDNNTYSTNTTKYLHGLYLLTKATGENCLEAAKIYFNLAKVESDCKNYGNAITYLSKSVNIIKNLKLQTHYHYKAIMEQIKLMHQQVVEYGEKKQWVLKSKGLLDIIDEDRIIWN